MRIQSGILTLLAAVASGCAAFQTRTPAEQSPVVGTWRWIAVDQQPVTQPFHIRFYADGTAATWPATAGSSVTNGVSRGRYHLEEFLVIETGSGKDDPRTQLLIKGNQMILINSESNRLYYLREIPDREPGM